MSDDNDNVTKLVVLVLGIATIGFFAYLIFKEYGKYKLGNQSQQMSLADDDLFNLERKIHNLEMAKNVRTLQPMTGVQTVGNGQKQMQEQFTSTEIDTSPIPPRKVVSMNPKRVQTPNVHNLSKADQEKVRRLFFNML